MKIFRVLQDCCFREISCFFGGCLNVLFLIVCFNEVAMGFKEVLIVFQGNLKGI